MTWIVVAIMCVVLLFVAAVLRGKFANHEKLTEAWYRQKLKSRGVIDPDKLPPRVIPASASHVVAMSKMYVNMGSQTKEWRGEMMRFADGDFVVIEGLVRGDYENVYEWHPAFIEFEKLGLARAADLPPQGRRPSSNA